MMGKPQGCNASVSREVPARRPTWSLADGPLKGTERTPVPAVVAKLAHCAACGGVHATPKPHHAAQISLVPSVQ